MQIQSHEIIDTRVEGLEARLVVKGMLDGRDRWNEIGHHVDGVDAARPEKVSLQEH